MQYLSQARYQHCNNDYGGRGLGRCLVAWRGLPQKGVAIHTIRVAQSGEATSPEMATLVRCNLITPTAANGSYTRMLSVD